MIVNLAFEIAGIECSTLVLIYFLVIGYGIYRLVKNEFK